MHPALHSIRLPQWPKDLMTKPVSCFLWYSIFLTMAGSVWWVILTITWFLAAVPERGSEATEKKALLFRASAWGIPGTLAIILLAMNKIEGDNKKKRRRRSGILRRWAPRDYGPWNWASPSCSSLPWVSSWTPHSILSASWALWLVRALERLYPLYVEASSFLGQGFILGEDLAVFWGVRQWHYLGDELTGIQWFVLFLLESGLGLQQLSWASRT